MYDPMMTIPDTKLLKKYLSNATNYFEFGSGGSTVCACNM